MKYYNINYNNHNNNFNSIIDTVYSYLFQKRNNVHTLTTKKYNKIKAFLNIENQYCNNTYL